MSSAYEYIPPAIRLIVLIYVLIRIYRLILRPERSLQFIFFTFSTVASLLTDIYWVTFDLLQPGARMPFAANEICECALFLSLASVIAAVTGTFTPPAACETACALMFLAANTGLWIAWSGEWIQDLISFLVLGSLLIRIIRHMKQTDALPALMWKVLGIICIVVIAANIATLLVPEAYKNATDLTAYLLMLAVSLYFMIKIILFLYKKENYRVALSLSFAMHFWCVMFLYMSAGFFYNVANFLATIAHVLIFIALIREAAL